MATKTFQAKLPELIYVIKIYEEKKGFFVLKYNLFEDSSLLEKERLEVEKESEGIAQFFLLIKLVDRIYRRTNGSRGVTVVTSQEKVYNKLRLKGNYDRYELVKLVRMLDKVIKQTPMEVILKGPRD